MIQKRKKTRTKQEGKTYCFSCRNFTDNVNKNKVTMTKKSNQIKIQVF